jgi:hypothetical protein
MATKAGVGMSRHHKRMTCAVGQRVAQDRRRGEIRCADYSLIGNLVTS